MIPISRIVVHCSDTPNERDVRAADIHQWHIERGWDGIGYHSVICRDGMEEMGRPEYWVGSHVKGFNRHSYGVCLIGRDEFTEDQMNVLSFRLRYLHARYPKADIYGHCELDPHKTCPNFDVQEWLNTQLWFTGNTSD